MNTCTYSLINPKLRSLKKITLLVFVHFVATCSSLFAQDLFDSTHTRQYAKYLLTTHQYKQALDEYNRLYFFSNQEANYLPSLIYALRKSDQELSVLQRFTNPDNLNDASFQQYIFCLVKANKIGDCVCL